MAEQVLKIPAKIENLDQVITFVDNFLEEHNCSMKVQTQMDIAVEEIYVNIAHYAYETEGGGNAEIRLENAEFQGEEAVSVTFLDSGIPYDPLAKPDPDITLSVEERPIGGLGIYMVKKSMDAMRYERKDGQNILTLIKRYS